MRDPDTVAIELDRMALDQTGPERGELTELAAKIRTYAMGVRGLVAIAEIRMKEIRGAAGMQDQDKRGGA